MIAAIYARKSTEQTGVADEQRSVARQIAHATEYATKKGWTVADEFVFVDDGVSGAEFAARPGFVRLMNALKPRPAFQVLIMSEESRLGREAIETAYALKQLVTAGVRVFFYLEDRERTLDSPTDKIMLALTAFADELEREKARQRTYDAMQRKARAGHVTGGACFGYRNVEVVGSDGRRSHVERAIDPAEAEIVRRIFRLSADGHRTKAIAKLLNGDGAGSPRAQRGRSQSWAPTSVREVLHRPLYHGEIVWNQTRKRDRWGQQHQTDRPAEEWIRVPAPALRIVSEDIWRAAHARLAAARSVYMKATNGRPFGRPPLGDPSKYLLTGLAQCGACGCGLIVKSRSQSQGRVFSYGCGGYHQRGPAVCRNARALSLDDADGIVLEALLDDVLTPDVLTDAVDEALGLVYGEPTPDRTRQIEAQLTRADLECGRLVAAIASGGDMPALVAALRERDAQRSTLRAELVAAGSQKPVRPSDAATVRNELLTLANDWREVLRKDAANARPIITKLIAGRVTFTPQEKPGYWEMRGTGTLAGLFGGTVVPRRVASPTGIEPVSRP